MPPILDTAPYPFHRPEAQQLLVTLVQVHPTARAAVMVAQDAGLNTGFIAADFPPFFVWRDVLTQAAISGLTRELVQKVHDRLTPTSPYRPFLAALLANRAPSTDAEPRGSEGEPNFLRDSDDISEPEALLYHDDLTIQMGQLPALIVTLQRLVEKAPSVCKLVVDFNEGSKNGTAFRIGPDLLLTNWHVLHNTLTGAKATVVSAEFGYEQGEGGVTKAATVIDCDVASIVTDKADDWAIVRSRAALQASWPILKLSEAAAPIANSSAYIIQHPNGDRKRVGFIRNQVTDFDDRVVHYLTDTQVGSSGAPVFDASGRLIALHHAGGRPQEVLGKSPVKKNEGIRIPCIIAGLGKHNIQVS